MDSNIYGINVTVKYGYAGEGCYGWTATLLWQDDKFLKSGAVEGEIRTRYFECTITEAIDYVVEVAKQFNLLFVDNFSLFYCNDGENLKDHPPDNWRQTLQEEAQKRGWKTYSS